MAERLAHVLVDPPVRQVEGAAVGRQQVHEEAVLGHLPLCLGWEEGGGGQSEPSTGLPPPGALSSVPHTKRPLRTGPHLLLLCAYRLSPLQDRALSQSWARDGHSEGRKETLPFQPPLFPAEGSSKPRESETEGGSDAGALSPTCLLSWDTQILTQALRLAEAPCSCNSLLSGCSPPGVSQPGEALGLQVAGPGQALTFLTGLVALNEGQGQRRPRCLLPLLVLQEPH